MLPLRYDMLALLHIRHHICFLLRYAIFRYAAMLFVHYAILRADAVAYADAVIAFFISPRHAAALMPLLILLLFHTRAMPFFAVVVECLLMMPVAMPVYFTPY